MEKFDWVLFISSLMLPIIPLLFLFNQNSEYLYFPIVAITGIILVLLIAIFHIIIRFLYKSDGIAFVSCLVFVFLLFALDSIYDLFARYYDSPLYFFMLTPLITYIFTYLIYRIFGIIQFQNLSIFILLFLVIMLGMNVYPLSYNLRTVSIGNKKFKYKLEFNVDKQLKSPNVYWFFCDGMLGFKAMEKYFHDSQLELITALTKRGFKINKDAMLESGHRTRIAIPALMCPDYHDKYLNVILDNHEDTMKLSMASDNDLYNSRVYNETINAFDAKGYTTITISINDIYFFPTTDFFYYINASDTNKREYITKPFYVRNDYDSKNERDKLRLYAYQFGDIFLGGLPGLLFDSLFKDDETILYELTTKCNYVSDVLLGNKEHEVHFALVENLYDALESPYINEPKFVIIHNMIAHRPFEFNEFGEKIEDSENIINYKGHHTYSAKVLLNLIDMVLQKDPDAIIILQADHGLHELSKNQIIEAFGNPDAVLDIWNNVLSAIRVPEQFQNGQEHYAMEDSRNISRYIINSFVGENYVYIQEEIVN